MGYVYNFNYSEKLPKNLGGGKARAFIRCGNYQQYKNELRDMINALRRELDRLNRYDKKKGIFT